MRVTVYNSVGPNRVIPQRTVKDEGDDRRDRSVFLFMSPRPGIDPEDHAQCATCWKFLRAIGKCQELREQDSVKPTWTCGQYSQGTPNDDPNAKPTGKYTPETVGLYKGRVQCHRCNGYDDRDTKHIHCDVYVQLNRMFPRLFKLKIEVGAHDCCNAWGKGARDPKQFGPYGPIPDPDDPNAGGLIMQLIKW